MIMKSHMQHVLHRRQHVGSRANLSASELEPNEEACWGHLEGWACVIETISWAIPNEVISREHYQAERT